MSKPLAAGEPCLLIDGKGRHYLLHLTEGARFDYHGGILTHSEIIGSLEGTSLTSSGGMRLVAIRPTFADFVLAMKRGAQVVYPKDLGPIVMWADIGPGMTVLEAGTGSGALAMALVRAVGPEGKVVSVEQRTDHAAHAAKMITRYFGEIPSTLTLEQGDVEDFVADVAPQRIVLDIPEPWSVVPAAVDGLEDGGVFCSYYRPCRRCSGCNRRSRNPSVSSSARVSKSYSGSGLWKAARYGRSVRWSGTPVFSRRRAKLSSWRVERDLVEVREATAWTTPSGKRPRYGSMKMHSPGHSSADSTTRSSCDSGKDARPAAPSDCPSEAA